MRTRVKNMKSPSGNMVPNQFIISTSEGSYFQSYATTVAFIPHNGKIQLDKEAWDYSRTTSKYLSIFLNEYKAEIRQKIADGEYLLVDLNNGVDSTECLVTLAMTKYRKELEVWARMIMSLND